MVEIKSLKDIRKEHIQQVLRSTKWDLDRASTILGVKTASLRQMMKEFGLTPDESTAPQDDRESS